MIKLFEVSEGENYYFLSLTWDFVESYSDYICSNSALVIAAHLLGLTYVDFLRYAAAKHNARIEGKLGFPHPVFENKVAAQGLCDVIQQYWGEFEKLLPQN